MIHAYLNFVKNRYICYFVSFQNVQQEHLALIVKKNVIVLTIPIAIKQMAIAVIENVKKDTQEKVAKQVRKLFFQHFSILNTF